MSGAPERPGYELEFEDDFEGAQLDRTKWFPYMLPHWTTEARSAARYRIGRGRITMLIEEDTPEWRPGENRVSNLETGHFAGPQGSLVGSFNLEPDWVVTTDLPTFRGYTPHFGYFETRIRATPEVGSHTALWMVGFEEMAAGEIQCFEIHGRHIGAERSRIDHGVLPWNDPRLIDERHQDWLPIDASEFHVYGIDWTPEHVDFFVDGHHVRRVGQSPQYAMQFELGVYEVPSEVAERDTPPAYPVTSEIDWFRGYRRLD